MPTSHSTLHPERKAVRSSPATVKAFHDAGITQSGIASTEAGATVQVIEANGFKIWGPNKQAAQFEASGSITIDSADNAFGATVRANGAAVALRDSNDLDLVLQSSGDSRVASAGALTLSARELTRTTVCRIGW